jgi:hypothetical protein
VNDATRDYFFNRGGDRWLNGNVAPIMVQQKEHMMTRFLLGTYREN